MSRTKKQTLEARVKQYNAMVEFMEKHNDDYYLQVNLAAPGSADHVCLPIPHKDAAALFEMVHSFLIGEVAK